MSNQNLRGIVVIIICLIVIGVAVQQLRADPFLVTTSAVANPEADIARAEQLNTWIYETTPYVGLTPLYVKTPAETLMKGGDCADMSAALILLLSAENIEAEMQTMYLYKSEQYHAVVVVHDMLFDPTTGEMFAHVFPRPHKIIRTVSKQRILADWRK